MLDNEKIEINKTLTDIIDPEILEFKAMFHWRQMSSSKKKQKGFVYNKVLQHSWGISEPLNWVVEYSELTDVQKRILLKKELINAYNELNSDDKVLFNEYLALPKENVKWNTLTQENKRIVIKTLFKIF